MKDSYEIRLSGTGGQGLILAGVILSESVLLEGKWAAQSQSFEPLSRGGISRADIVVNSERIDYPLVTDLDLLLILDQVAAVRPETGLKTDGIVLVDSDHVDPPDLGGVRWVRLPLVETARALGSLRAANMVALGAMSALTGICRRTSLQSAIPRLSPRGSEEINVSAMEAGYRMGRA